LEGKGSGNLTSSLLAFLLLIIAENAAKRFPAGSVLIDIRYSILKKRRAATGGLISRATPPCG
jgi:hypothetical protein